VRIILSYSHFADKPTAIATVAAKKKEGDEVASDDISSGLLGSLGLTNFFIFFLYFFSL